MQSFSLNSVFYILIEQREGKERKRGERKGMEGKEKERKGEKWKGKEGK